MNFQFHPRGDTGPHAQIRAMEALVASRSSGSFRREMYGPFTNARPKHVVAPDGGEPSVSGISDVSGCRGGIALRRQYRLDDIRHLLR